VRAVPQLGSRERRYCSLPCFRRRDAMTTASFSRFLLLLSIIIRFLGDSTRAPCLRYDENDVVRDPIINGQIHFPLNPSQGRALALARSIAIKRQGHLSFSFLSPPRERIPLGQKNLYRFVLFYFVFKHPNVNESATLRCDISYRNLQKKLLLEARSFHSLAERKFIAYSLLS